MTSSWPCAALAGDKSAMERPNFLLITIDALRPDHLSCYGYHKVTTPNLDRLAATGIRFENAITNGGWTQPGMVSLLTSTYPLMYEGCRKPLSPARPSLPEMLVGAGYCTVAFTANPQVGTAFRYDRGFQIFEDVEPHRANPWWYRLRGHARLLRNPWSHRLLQWVGQRALPPAVSCAADALTDRLLRWLADCRSPFFAWIHYMDTHFPYQVDRDLKTPEQLAASWRKLKALYDSAGQRYAEHPGDEVMEQVLADYDRAILWVDENVGRILRQLESQGLSETTAVIVTSDHGEQFFEHGNWSHLGLYDEIVRVPLVMRIPGLEQPKVISRLVAHIDFAPTILDLVGISEKDPRMCGKSLLPFLDGSGDVPEREWVISEMVMGPKSHYLAVRTLTHKYIHWMAKPQEPELYDLTADPEERENVVSRYPELASRFRAVVERHLEQVEATRSEAQETQAEVSEEVVERLRALGYLD
ncbi:MAG: DUF4976 domain-containing protein [Chloroflexi bacterium]|nr:MAG: DUF4976 domain-containing protein [Chloroflexota bacterium]